MLTPLFIPILILALGASVLVLLGAIPRMRGLHIVAAGVAGLALVALMWLGTQLPLEGMLSSWRPLALLGAPLTFEANAENWSLAMVLAGTSFLSLLAGSVSQSRPTTANMALILAGTGAGVAALFASSFVALIVTWCTMDILLASALLRYGPKGARRAGLALFSGVLATSALWAAPLLSQAEGISGFLRLAHFTGSSASLLQMAVILRLGVVPLHLWRPIDLETEADQVMPLVVIPTLLGFHLLTYLPALTAGLPSTLFALAAVTVLVGGFVAWSETEERLSVAGITMAETGLAVLAVANAGQKAVATRAKKAISQFKIRKGMEIGVKVTLRGRRMYDFYCRLIHVCLPRVRDFNGVFAKGFDGRGNFTIGIKEHIIFPEIEYDKIEMIKGMNINIVTTAKDDQMGRRLLELMGMPFRKN